jgi:hypothetical protein
VAEVSEDDLALIIEALEDAAFYRDTRSRVLESAVRRHTRHSPPAPRSDDDQHRDKARAYNALALRLKRGRRSEPAAPD